MKPHRGLKECPFCGAVTPDLRITGAYDINDGREYRVKIECDGCDCQLVYDVGYRTFSTLGRTENECGQIMLMRLFEKWNRRSGYKLIVEVT